MSVFSGFKSLRHSAHLLSPYGAWGKAMNPCCQGRKTPKYGSTQGL